jgi:hypothetical protein
MRVLSLWPHSSYRPRTTHILVALRVARNARACTSARSISFVPFGFVLLVRVRVQILWGGTCWISNRSDIAETWWDAGGNYSLKNLEYRVHVFVAFVIGLALCYEDIIKLT